VDEALTKAKKYARLKEKNKEDKIMTRVILIIGNQCSITTLGQAYNEIIRETRLAQGTDAPLLEETIIQKREESFYTLLADKLEKNLSDADFFCEEGIRQDNTFDPSRVNNRQNRRGRNRNPRALNGRYQSRNQTQYHRR